MAGTMNSRLLDVCQQNKIKPTIGFDSSSDEAVGTLSKIAAAFERLLLPKMRSPASEAMVKRLQRSLRREEQRVEAASTRVTSRGERRQKRPERINRSSRRFT